MDRFGSIYPVFVSVSNGLNVGYSWHPGYPFFKGPERAVFFPFLFCFSFSMGVYWAHTTAIGFLAKLNV